MEGIILFYGSGIVIGIAESAHMETGIIRSNVISHKTGARLSKRLFLRDRKCGMKCFLVGSLCHAAAAVGAVSSQFLSFPAWVNRHSMGSRDLDHIFPKI